MAIPKSRITFLRQPTGLDEVARDRLEPNGAKDSNRSGSEPKVVSRQVSIEFAIPSDQNARSTDGTTTPASNRAITSGAPLYLQAM